LSTANSTDLQLLVREAIASAAGVDIAELREDRDVFELGLDSLDFWSILLDIEEQVGSQVPPEVLDQLAALDDVVTVGRLLNAVSGWDPAVDLAQG
jgi:acyl carrier protein